MFGVVLFWTLVGDYRSIGLCTGTPEIPFDQRGLNLGTPKACRRLSDASIRALHLVLYGLSSTSLESSCHPNVSGSQHLHSSLNLNSDMNVDLHVLFLDYTNALLQSSTYVVCSYRFYAPVELPAIFPYAVYYLERRRSGSKSVPSLFFLIVDTIRHPLPSPIHNTNYISL